MSLQWKETINQLHRVSKVDHQLTISCHILSVLRRVAARKLNLFFKETNLANIRMYSSTDYVTILCTKNY